jgi:uncharacterized protein YbcI
MDEQQVSGDDRKGGDADEISRQMVMLHKQYGGKGPTRCKTYIEDDLIVVLLGGAYTAAEQTLFEAGRSSDVRQIRHAFEDAIEGRLIQKIEQITGRRVVAFMSASHQAPDLMLESFVLEPSSGKPSPYG